MHIPDLVSELATSGGRAAPGGTVPPLQIVRARTRPAGSPGAREPNKHMLFFAVSVWSARFCDGVGDAKTTSDARLTAGRQGLDPLCLCELQSSHLAEDGENTDRSRNIVGFDLHRTLLSVRFTRPAPIRVDDSSRHSLFSAVGGTSASGRSPTSDCSSSSAGAGNLSARRLGFCSRRGCTQSNNISTKTSRSTTSGGSVAF
jgi:hypothetical protein